VSLASLSRHFTLAEMTRTSTRGADGELVPNEPPGGAILELIHLCETVLEPVRALLGVPLHINSGYRSEALQRALYHLGPAAPLKTSQHMRGQAADFVPVGLDVGHAMEVIASTPEIPWDQVILERVRGSEWIHVSCAPSHRKPRRQALYTTDGRTYVPFLPGMAGRDPAWP
jgi:zinc D-Ala-D-Ala carboxypeptidase